MKWFNGFALIVAFLLQPVFGQLAIAEDFQYQIGAGDVLEISVWKDESLSRVLVVPPDGILSFPLVGDISTSGMTVSRLRKKVTELISVYVPDPTVTVMLKELNSLTAYVIGKVNKPGQFPITMGTTVMQLLSKAEGLNPYAAEDKIHILRTKNFTTVRIPFNYSEVVKGRILDQNIVIQRGDVVVVP